MAVFVNNNQDKKDKEQTENQDTLSSGNSLGSSSSTSSQISAPAAPQKGSGRFTNLQQYLNANKAGGQELVGGIGNKIQKDIDPAKTDSQKANEEIKKNLQSSNDTLAKGQGNLNDLKTINQNIKSNTGADKYNNNADLGIQSFTSNPNYNDFKNIQSGGGVNENLLNFNQSQFANAANNYYDVANTSKDKIGTETGRFDLLKNTYGGNVNPQYSTGLQRLDQALLQRADLGGLKSNLAQEVNNAKELGALSGTTGRDVGNVIAGEQNLIGNIGDAATANEDDYIKMLSSYVPKINELRDADWTKLSNQLKNTAASANSIQIDDPYLQKATPKTAAASTNPNDYLDSASLAKLGITTPTRVYNALNGLTNADVATKGRSATGYQDVASQNDVNNYNSLASILGLDSDNKRLTEANNLGNAWDSRTDAGSLTNRVSDAAKQFEADAKAKTQYKVLPRANTISSAPVGYVSGLYGGYGGQNFMDALNDKGIAAGVGSGSKDDILTPSFDTDLLKFVREKGYGNILAPTGGIKNTANNLDQYIKQGTVDRPGKAGSLYDTSIDDQLRQAYQNLIDQYKV